MWVMLLAQAALMLLMALYICMHITCGTSAVQDEQQTSSSWL
jgi:hypothetical protein